MPRGPGKSSNYNLDYSRFNFLDKEDVDLVLGKDALASTVRFQSAEKENESTEAEDPDLPEMTEVLRKMPPELQEAYRLMAISRASGDEAAQRRANELALKAVERGGPEIRKAFLQELSKQAPEVASDLKLSLSLSDADKAPKVEDKIEILKAQMEAGKAATRRQMEALQKQQEELESIKGPEDFLRMMHGQGMTNEDVQRMLTGDQAHMEQCLKKMIDSTAVEKQSRQAEEAVKAAEKLHESICGEISKPDGSEIKDSPPAKIIRTPKVEDEVVIPTHRLQYQRDADGKFSAVEFSCSLPGILEMSSIALDVAEKHIRLNTTAPGPQYVVNAGPFPVLIEPSAARAKFSKKKQELTLHVPAKLGR